MSGFIDDESVDRVAHRLVGEQEARAHNDVKLLCIGRNLFCIFDTLYGYLLFVKNEGSITVFWFDTNTQWFVGGKAVVFRKLGDLAQQLVGSSVCIGRDANSVTFFYQRKNGVGCRISLACARRTLNDEVRVVEVVNGVGNLHRIGVDAFAHLMNVEVVAKARWVQANDVVRSSIRVAIVVVDEFGEFLKRFFKLFFRKVFAFKHRLRVSDVFGGSAHVEVDGAVVEVDVDDLDFTCWAVVFGVEAWWPNGRR